MKLLHRQGSLEIGSTPILMGILNVTPDSFSDGGDHDTPDTALARALDMLGEGADIIDIGGESTRPGAEPVAGVEECRRVLPVIELIRRERPDALISIDTTKADVARRAVHAGAAIINDVSGGLWDPEMSAVVHQLKPAFICAHALDRPQKMQLNPEYSDVVREVGDFLSERKKQLMELDIPAESLCFDVGIGFGKTLEHNLDLIRGGMRDAFAKLERPLLWGLSRKSFIQKRLQRSVEDRLPGGLAAYGSLLQSKTPQIWRVHDVQATSDFLTMHRTLNP
jgi:dihydropteroate synthase